MVKVADSEFSAVENHNCRHKKSRGGTDHSPNTVVSGISAARSRLDQSGTGDKEQCDHSVTADGVTSAGPDAEREDSCENESQNRAVAVPDIPQQQHHSSCEQKEEKISEQSGGAEGVCDKQYG